MITEELRRFLDMVRTEEAQDTLHEMANLGTHNRGIQDVVLWVGKTNKQHGLRIKVSNSKNRWNNADNFVIRISSLDYDPASVAKWITPAIMSQILNRIKLNQQLLCDFETGKIVFTDQFIAAISKV